MTDLSKIDFSKCKLPEGYSVTQIGHSTCLFTGHTANVAQRTSPGGVWSVTSMVSRLTVQDLQKIIDCTKMVDAFIAEQSAKENAYPKVAGLTVDIAAPEVFRADGLLRNFLPKYITAYFYRVHSGDPWTWWLVDVFGNVARKIENMPQSPTVGVYRFIGSQGLTYDITSVKCADYDEILRSRAVHETERKRAAPKKDPRLPTVKLPDGIEWKIDDYVGDPYVHVNGCNIPVPFSKLERDVMSACVAAYDELHPETAPAVAQGRVREIELNYPHSRRPLAINVEVLGTTGEFALGQRVKIITEADVRLF